MYHSFIDKNGNEYGSFEVFLSTWEPQDLGKRNPGYYWWSCFPGCLPDSDPVGPFDSEVDAINNANEV